MRSFFSLFFLTALLASNTLNPMALASELVTDFRCDSKQFNDGGVAVRCFYYDSKEVKNEFIGPNTKFNLYRGTFFGEDGIEKRNPNCTEDPYSGLKDCGGEPEYITFMFSRNGRILADLSNFRNLFERYKGSFGGGKLRVQCARPDEMSDCYFEILSYAHLLGVTE